MKQLSRGEQTNRATTDNDAIWHKLLQVIQMAKNTADISNHNEKPGNGCRQIPCSIVPDKGGSDWLYITE
jgi:hypothetical protein